MGSGCELYRWTHHYCAVCEKAAPTLCFVHTHPLWVALHKLCATLHPPVCVFRALLPLITSSVDSLLSLYFAIWVVCICYVWKQHRFFSALENKQNTMKKKRRKFGFILLSLSQSKPSAFCVLNLFLQENQELNRQALASVVMIDRCLWSQRSEDFSRGLKQLTNVFQHFD